MKPTVSQGISSKSPDQGRELEWITREGITSLQQLRAAANFTVRVSANGTSDGAGTGLELWRSEEMPSDGAWYLTYDIIGCPQDAPVANAIYATITELAYTTAVGALTISGAATVYNRTNAGLTATAATDSRRRVLTVNDGSLAAFRWYAVVSIMEIVVR